MRIQMLPPVFKCPLWELRCPFRSLNTFFGAKSRFWGSLTPLLGSKCPALGSTPPTAGAERGPEALAEAPPPPVLGPLGPSAVLPRRAHPRSPASLTMAKPGVRSAAIEVPPAAAAAAPAAPARAPPRVRASTLTARSARRRCRRPPQWSPKAAARAPPSPAPPRPVGAPPGPRAVALRLSRIPPRLLRSPAQGRGLPRAARARTRRGTTFRPCVLRFLCHPTFLSSGGAPLGGA